MEPPTGSYPLGRAGAREASDTVLQWHRQHGHVARYLTRRLAGAPVQTELRSIERQPAGTLADFDVLALGFPVYACDSPLVIQRYLERLAPGEGRGAYVFCTKGAVAGNAVLRNLRRLAARGYVPLGGTTVGMPGSDGLAFLRKGSWMVRAAVEKNFDRLAAVDRLAQRMSLELAAMRNGETAAAFHRPLPLSVTGAVFDWLWSATYQAIAGYMRSRFWADHRCTVCGLCARICPVGSIEMVDGHPRFNDGCELCMRCIHACPNEAIQIGKATVGKFRWHGPIGDFRPLTLRPVDADLREIHS